MKPIVHPTIAARINAIPILWLLFAFLPILPVSAQQPAWEKMSPFVRQAAREIRQPVALRSAATRQRVLPRAALTAFVRASGDGEAVLKRHGCKVLLRRGDLFIADIPLLRLAALSRESTVERIEAGRGTRVQMDSTRLHVDALPVYAGQQLPQAYDGTGVVVGVQDIGFDLTHPTFYSRDMSRYRIGALWDHLSTDTIGSSLPAGRDYVGREALLRLGCSRDGRTQTHGTHTAGIAAGSGFDSPYQGMAPGATLCLVANATTDNAALIDSADLYKYTYALDALGFKYIFDYADSLGQPCVINFSEGSTQDFHGYDQLYYAMLDSLCGPGHILVASAGNQGGQLRYFRKEAGRERAGCFIGAGVNHVSFTLKSKSPFRLVSTIYGEPQRTLVFRTDDVLLAKDSVLTDTATVDNHLYFYNVEAYPNSYDSTETCYDVYVVAGSEGFGSRTPVSVAVEGADADVSCYAVTGDFRTNNLDVSLNAGDESHTVGSPGSAPCVICVGATTYRSSFVNYVGESHAFGSGNDGRRDYYSSMGPTYDERIKPDVMAPGTNIVSSCSSYYLEGHDSLAYTWSDIAHFDYGGRTYTWTSNAGTSMSSPVVAGAVALWLQARPDLTPDDVRDVLAHTAYRYDNTLEYPNNYYGYGQIDVYKGLLYLLGIDAVEGLSTHRPRGLSVGVDGSAVALRFAEPPRLPFNIRVYSAAGALLLNRNLPAGETLYRVPAGALPSGVYAVQVDGADFAGGSTLIRK